LECAHFKPFLQRGLEGQLEVARLLDDDTVFRDGFDE
jgi:hypothetical protein